MEDNFVKHQGTYLLSHSVGLPLKTARIKSEEEFWTPWVESKGDEWNHWLSYIERFRKQLGHFLNSDAQNFCPQTNISSAVTKIIFSLDKPNKKNVILMSEEDFPSVAFALQQSKSLGYYIRYIPAGLDLNNLQIWDDYLKEDVALVLVTQVQSNNGVQLPIDAISSMAKQRSIFSLIDIAQSIGILPIDIKKWSADFIVGSCVKWLSGGPGAGFMWVNPDIIEYCKPCDVGWFSHEDPFEFKIHEFRYAKDALRFWGGTPSIHPYLVAFRSLEFVINLGVDTIRKHNIELSNMIIKNLDKINLISPSDTNYRSGTNIIHFGKKHEQMVQILKKNNIHFDSRVKGIRLSPHLYNSKDQIDSLLSLINNNR
jgi:kynureninase